MDTVDHIQDLFAPQVHIIHKTRRSSENKPKK